MAGIGELPDQKRPWRNGAPLGTHVPAILPFPVDFYRTGWPEGAYGPCLSPVVMCSTVPLPDTDVWYVMEEPEALGWLRGFPRPLMLPRVSPGVWLTDIYLDGIWYRIAILCSGSLGNWYASMTYLIFDVVWILNPPAAEPTTWTLQRGDSTLTITTSPP